MEGQPVPIEQEIARIFPGADQESIRDVVESAWIIGTIQEATLIGCDWLLPQQAGSEILTLMLFDEDRGPVRGRVTGDCPGKSGRSMLIISRTPLPEGKHSVELEEGGETFVIEAQKTIWD